VHFVASVRTVVVTVSPLLASLVIELLQPTMSLQVVGELAIRDDLFGQLRALAPDLVLLGLHGVETDDLVLPLLTAVPSALFLVVAPNGQHAWLHELRPHRTELKDFSAAALVEALTTRFHAPGSQG
jgi:hypothetical protein